LNSFPAIILGKLVRSMAHFPGKRGIECEPRRAGIWKDPKRLKTRRRTGRISTCPVRRRAFRPSLFSTQEEIVMWPFLASSKYRASCHSPSRARRRTARKPKACRPQLEALEERTVLDVGDSLGSALLTGLGPTAGAYTMPSEFMGDGRFKTMDVDF